MLLPTRCTGYWYLRGLAEATAVGANGGDTTWRLGDHVRVTPAVRMRGNPRHATCCTTCCYGCHGGRVQPYTIPPTFHGATCSYGARRRMPPRGGLRGVLECRPLRQRHRQRQPRRPGRCRGRVHCGSQLQRRQPLRWLQQHRLVAYIPQRHALSWRSGGAWHDADVVYTKEHITIGPYTRAAGGGADCVDRLCRFHRIQ